MKDIITKTAIFNDIPAKMFNEPEYKLYVSVLNRVFLDVVQSNRQDIYRSAVKYMSSRDCKTICDYLNVDHSVVKQEFEKLLANRARIHSILER